MYARRHWRVAYMYAMTCLPGRVAHSINKIMPVWLMTWHEWWCIVLTYEQWCIVLTWTIMHCHDVNNDALSRRCGWVHSQPRIGLIFYISLHYNVLMGACDCTIRYACIWLYHHALPWHSIFIYTCSTMYNWCISFRSYNPLYLCL